MYLNSALNLYMTLSSADNPFQVVLTKNRPNILSGPDRDPNSLTL